MIAYSISAKPATKPGAPRLAFEMWVFATAILFASAAAQAKDKPRQAPVPKPATQYAAFDTHAAEHVTIAAEPCEDPKACAFFRVAYIQHDFIPIWVIVTNDRDQPLALDDVRIQLLPAAGDRLQAATEDELNRGLFRTRQALGTRLPILPITIHHEAVDEKVQNDDTDFGFKSLTVAPHSTAAGYVFYDINGLDDPPLKGAELLVKMLRTTDARGDKQELFAFTVPLDMWLATRPKEKK